MDTTDDPAMDSARRIDEYHARQGYTRESAVQALLDARAHTCPTCGTTMDLHHNRNNEWIDCRYVLDQRLARGEVRY